MLARLAPLFDLPPEWQRWAAPVLGLTAAALTLFVGRVLVSRWRSRAHAAAGSETSGQAGTSPERRKSPRRRGPTVKVLVSDPDGRATRYSALLLDRSPGGMRLSVAEAVPVGTLLTVGPPEGSPSVPWLQMEVKYCIRQDDTWLVGCKFVGTPSWSVLMLFESEAPGRAP
jgi:hypothetical protein